MKLTMFILLFSITITIAWSNCNNAYSSASYGLAHTKKALSANNFDHQRYYAERALTAFEKTEKLLEVCGCESSRGPLVNALENLSKSIDPKDWEMGRYYSKKALANAQDVIAALDVCTSGQDAVMLPENSADYSTTVDEELKNPEELEAQQNVKRLAELTLFEIEKSIKELGQILNCDAAKNIHLVMTEKTDKDLESESLEETRIYYQKQGLILQRSAMKALSACSGSNVADLSMEGEQ